MNFLTGVVCATPVSFWLFLQKTSKFTLTAGENSTIMLGAMDIFAEKGF